MTKKYRYCQSKNVGDDKIFFEEPIAWKNQKRLDICLLVYDCKDILGLTYGFSVAMIDVRDSIIHKYVKLR